MSSSPSILHRYLSPMFGHLKAGKRFNVPVSVVFHEDMGPAVANSFQDQFFVRVFEATKDIENQLNNEIKEAIHFIRGDTLFIQKKQRKLALVLARNGTRPPVEVQNEADDLATLAEEDRVLTAKLISEIKARCYFRYLIF